MKKFGEYLEVISGKAVTILAFIIVLALSYYSLRYTYVSIDRTERVMEISDNAILNLAFAALSIGIVIIISSMILDKKDKAQKRQNVLLIIVLIFSLLISVGWVIISHGKPYGDQAAIYSMASSFIAGNYEAMLPGGYMFSYPQQYGMVAFIEMLFRVFGNGKYFLVQYINAFCMPLFIYAFYRLIEILFPKTRCQVYFLLLIPFCLPLLLYVPFVYGEVISITFTTVMLWKMVEVCKYHRIESLIWGTLAATFACALRQNSIIIVIAMAIVMMIHTVKNRKPIVLIAVGTMALFITMSDAGIKNFYEYRSGIEIDAGTPRLLYILMGMGDNYAGPGWYDHTVYTLYNEQGFDREATKEIGYTKVRERLEEFRQNPDMCKDFYKRKILTQWNEPTLDSVFVTTSFDLELEQLPAITYEVYYGTWYNQLMSFMNNYQFLIYILAAGGLLGMLVKRCTIEQVVLSVCLVGGFLFTILWEAKSRYVLPYFVLLIPVAAYGVTVIQHVLLIIANYIKGKRNDKKESVAVD